MNGEVDDSSDTRTVRSLRRVMTVFTGFLVASTWPLWTPGTEFPDIPWFGWAVHLPPEEWDWVWLVALGGLLAMQFLPLPMERRWPTILKWILFGGAVMLLPTDQHRLQPWVWQMLIGTILIAVSPTDHLALWCLRAFTASVYLWSAVSKADWAFIEGHGQVLLEGLAEALYVTTGFWSDTWRHLLAALFPCGELVVAMLLVFRQTRRWGMWSAILMHGLLMLVLGPWGLGHEWGVVIWNGFFVALVWLLFHDGRGALLPERNIRDCSGAANPQALIATVLTWTVCALPAVSLVGHWDWWPSWAVYSSRPAVVQVFVDQRDVDTLPSSLRPHVGSPRPLSNWYLVNLDAWSYATCRCPLYPQERYRLAIIAAIAEEHGIEPRVIVRSSPDRWTGRRFEETLTAVGLQSRLNLFWINISPRKPPRPPASD